LSHSPESKTKSLITRLNPRLRLGSIFSHNDDAVLLQELKLHRLFGVEDHAVRQVWLLGQGLHAEPDGDLILATGGFHHGVEVQGDTGLHIIAHRLDVNLRPLGIEDVLEDSAQMFVLRNLRQHKADEAAQMIALTHRNIPKIEKR
jgi:hypothetical protein